MTVPTEHCPSLGKGGQGKGLSCRKNNPGDQGGHEGCDNIPPWNWHEVSVAYLVHAQCEHIHKSTDG